jgi:serine/threonine protein kinase
MPDEIMQAWLYSRKPARIEGRLLRPLAHPMTPDMPLVAQRAQADCVVLLDDSDGSRWILKKFHRGRQLDAAYLLAVSRAMPTHDGLEIGRTRRVLTPASLGSGPGLYLDSRFGPWIAGSVLMAQAPGMCWGSLADDLRSGHCHLLIDQRVALCRMLADIVQAMEQVRLAHRDLSSGNVYIDLNTLRVCLIDFDSACHPSTPMPQATTCGTAGYLAPFVWQGTTADARASWCPCADRFALALLCTEFMLAGIGSVATGDGGLFDQEELRRRKGPGLRSLQRQLAQYGHIARLLDSALASTGFATCPSPQDWLNGLALPSRADSSTPQLKDMEPIEPDYFKLILARTRERSPIFVAPSLPNWRP